MFELDSWYIFDGKLHGNVYGNPNFKDGTVVQVSHPVEFDLHTRILHTRSGNVYHLGRVGDIREESEELSSLINILYQ